MIVFFEEKYHLSEKRAFLLHIITYRKKQSFQNRFILRKKTLRRFTLNSSLFWLKLRRVFILAFSLEILISIYFEKILYFRKYFYICN